MAKVRRPKVFAKVEKPKKKDLEVCIVKMQVEVKHGYKKKYRGQGRKH